MNIPSVPGGNGPIFDTRYCRRKFLQNLVRGIGWPVRRRLWAPGYPTPGSSWPKIDSNSYDDSIDYMTGSKAIINLN